MAQMQVEIPGELSTIATAVQGMVGQLLAGQNVIQVAGAAMPILFSESSKLDEIKKELKDPQTLVWAGLLVGTLVATYGPALMAKMKKAPAVDAAVAAVPAV